MNDPGLLQQAGAKRVTMIWYGASVSLREGNVKCLRIRW